MSTPLDLDHLRTFVAIVDAGSFTRAADDVFKTQSAVSMQMRRLEESQETLSAFDDEAMQGHVRIGLPDDYAERFLPEILARFSRSKRHRRSLWQRLFAKRCPLEVGVLLPKSMALEKASAGGDSPFLLARRQMTRRLSCEIIPAWAMIRT